MSGNFSTTGGAGITAGNANPFSVGGSSTLNTTSATGLAITPQGTGGATGGTISGNNLLSAASVQMFRTVPIPNRLANLFSLHCFKKTTQVAKGSVSNPSAINSITSIYANKSSVLYNFPISPAGYTKTMNAVTTRYMIKGSNKSNPGMVDYTFDEYGYTPPSFLIEGTTGWKYHTLDGGLYSGYQSFHNLQGVLHYYFDNNANVLRRSDRYVLALYDYYNQLYWEVEPVGEQTFSMSEHAPLNGYYRLYLEGVKNVANPPSTLELTSVLDQMIANVMVSAVNTASSLIAPLAGVVNDIKNVPTPLGY
jgi:hypothetical protein